MTPDGPVFISHAGADRVVAQLLAEHLRAVRIDVWIDQSESDLPLGKDWLAAIESGLERCSGFVVIVGTVDPDGCTPCARVTDSNPGADTERAWAGGAIKTHASVFGGEDGVISLFEVGG